MKDNEVIEKIKPIKTANPNKFDAVIRSDGKCIPLSPYLIEKYKLMSGKRVWLEYLPLDDEI